MGLGSGDKLARGAVRATFGPSSAAVSDEKWREAFGTSEVKKAVYIFACPVHGYFENKTEFYISGGYPQGPDKYKTGKCPKCEETSVYSGFQVIDLVDSE